MMPKVEFRCPRELHAELTRLAALEGLSVGEWARKTCADKAGIKVEVKLGLGGADKRTRQKVEKARLQGIKRRAKAHSNGK